MNTTEFSMLAKTFKGLEQVLAAELVQLGANNVQVERRAVSFTGDLRMLYTANMCLRTATRVLVPIASFKAQKADDIYEHVKALDWSEFMTLKTTFQIDATVYSDYFRHSQFVTYRVKDAIVDYWMEREGQRPNVRLEGADLYLNIHIAGDRVTLSLDSSGESLHKRGYRVANTQAPINEALAAGMLLLAGWNGQSDFYDPMCGSGTLLNEAALIARNIAPGVYRQGFAFEKWANFNVDLWEDVYNDDSRERDFKYKIYGSDAGFYAAQAAQKNIQSAGLQRDIEVRQVRVQELKAEDGKLGACHVDGALVMINPPYGERLSQDKDVLRLYQDMGTALKHQFSGATAWVISSNEEALKCIGLRPAKRIRLFNGDLDCLFNQYVLFKGDHKSWKKSL
jgi:putative N6-adenine-specific DNA methylase